MHERLKKGDAVRNDDTKLIIFTERSHDNVMGKLYIFIHDSSQFIQKNTEIVP
jgi:hypothetical protein